MLLGDYQAKNFNVKEGVQINPKIQKIDTEIEKARTKISELQGRIRDWERQKTELENAEIIALVRGIRGTKGMPEDITALIQSLQGGGTPEPAAPTPQPAGASSGADTEFVHQNEREDDNEV